MSTKNFVSYGDAETLFTGVGNKLSSLKSGLTDLDNEVNGDATTYPYADVITIEDAIPANVADCKVKIEPVQDLHGQSAPYVGGAYRNKLPLTVDVIKASNISGTWRGNVYSENGATITILTDSDDNVTGIKAEAPNTPSDTVQFNLCYKGTGNRFNDIENTSVTMNGCPTGGSENTYYIQFYKYDGTLQVKDTGTGVTFTPSNIPSDARVRITIKSAIPSGGVIFLPMIRLSTETDATYAPYTNICPITGHTEASVQRDGKNLWTGKFLNDSFAASDTYGGNYIRAGNVNQRVYPGTTYCYSVDGVSKGMRYTITDIDGNTIVSPTTANYVTIPNNGAFIFWRSVDDVLSGDVKAQLELGSTATPYVPYAGKTYTIALGDTIYGGTVDFDSGVMTVTHQYVTKNTSTMNNLEQYPGWTGSGIKQIVGSGIDDVVSTCVNVSDVIRANTLNINDILFFEKNDIGLTQTELIALAIDVAFVVELATPTTIQLTPKQIQLLKGQNTLTASTGQISVTVNGVSGAIGSVQEQVNEIETRVGNVEQDVSTIKSTDLIEIVGEGDGAQYFTFTFTHPFKAGNRHIFTILRGNQQAPVKMALCMYLTNYSSTASVVSDDENVTSSLDNGVLTITVDCGTNAWNRPRMWINRGVYNQLK